MEYGGETVPVAKLTGSNASGIGGDRSSRDQALTAMLRTVKSGRVQHHPFPHLLIDSILPEEMYHEMITSLPPWSQMRPIALSGADLSAYNRRSSVLIYPVISNGGDQGHSSFLQAATLLASEKLAGAVMNRLGATLTDAMHVEVRMDCDRAGARMTPHTDSPGKVATLIVYLHSGHRGVESGTRLMKPRESWMHARGERDYSDTSYQHEADQDFLTACRIPFIPNSALAFMRSPLSFHSYGPVAPQAAPRYILNLSVKKIDS